MISRLAMAAACKKPQLVFISGNVGKVKEVGAILSDHYNVSALSIDLPEYQGEPEEIVKEKGLAALRHCQLNSGIQLGDGLIIEDTSLCFNALGGMPGPYVKWFLKKCGANALHRMLSDFDDKSAYAQCTFAFCKLPSNNIAEAKVEIFAGKINGHIVKPRGSNEFGWDPIFEPDGYQETFAEMAPAVKNKISHRYNALMAMKTFLDTEFCSKNVLPNNK